MATAVWPAISPQELEIEEKRALTNELEWLLSALQESLAALKSGFEECAQLLSPADQQGSTLPLSSHRSEAVKGIVTRVGARIIKGDVKVRLATLPSAKGQSAFPLIVSSAAQAPTLVLSQLVDVRDRINSCLDVVDASAWAGDTKDAGFISGQLRLLDVNIQEARAALKGGLDATNVTPWYTEVIDASAFDPALPSNLAVHFFITDSALTLEIRTLESANENKSDFHTSLFTGRIAQALGAAKPLTHDEMDEVFMYRGKEVKVKEKVRVESLDPKLMAASAKLAALERTVGHARAALNVVMGKEE